MCRPIDFLYENVKEAKICFGYNLESIGPTTLRPQQNCVIFDDLSDDTHPVSVASVVFELLIFRKKGCNPDPVNSWTVKIEWFYHLYGSWFYNFMKISVKSENRSWVIIANVLGFRKGSYFQNPKNLSSNSSYILSYLTIKFQWNSYNRW